MAQKVPIRFVLKTPHQHLQRKDLSSSPEFWWEKSCLKSSFIVVGYKGTQVESLSRLQLLIYLIQNIVHY